MTYCWCYYLLGIIISADKEHHDMTWSGKETSSRKQSSSECTTETLILCCPVVLTETTNSHHLVFAIGTSNLAIKESGHSVKLWLCLQSHFNFLLLYKSVKVINAKIANLFHHCYSCKQLLNEDHLYSSPGLLHIWRP